MKKISSLFFLAFVCQACVSEFLLPNSVPFKKMPVLNCILNPDSTIKIALSFNKPANADPRHFEPIPNATITLYENDLLLAAQIPFDTVTQHYTLNYQPKANHKYHIKASNIAGFSDLEATDIVPPTLNDFAITFLPSVPNSPQGQLNIGCTMKNQFQNNPNARYWFAFLIHDFAFNTFPLRGCDTNKVIIKRTYAETQSTLADGFLTKSIDTDRMTSGELIRLNDLATPKDSISILFNINPNFCGMFSSNINNLHPKQDFFIDVLSTSLHFDKYLKTSLLEVAEKRDMFYSPNPFSQSILVYSNIANGLGIFAAVSTKRKSIKP